MKKYKVFKNPLGNIVAVKVGFSWLSMFFSWIYFFINKMWIEGWVVLLVCISLGAAAGYLNASGVAEITAIVVSVACGFYGNAGRCIKLAERGYEVVAELEAHTVEGAVATYMKENQDSKTANSLTS